MAVSGFLRTLCVSTARLILTASLPQVYKKLFPGNGEYPGKYIPFFCVVHIIVRYFAGFLSPRLGRSIVVGHKEGKERKICGITAHVECTYEPHTLRFPMPPPVASARALLFFSFFFQSDVWFSRIFNSPHGRGGGGGRVDLGRDTQHTKPRKNVISGALDPFPSSHRSIWIERGGAEKRKEKVHISQEGKNR